MDQKTRVAAPLWEGEQNGDSVSLKRDPNPGPFSNLVCAVCGKVSFFCQSSSRKMLTDTLTESRMVVTVHRGKLQCFACLHLGVNLHLPPGRSCQAGDGGTQWGFSGRVPGPGLRSAGGPRDTDSKILACGMRCAPDFGGADSCVWRRNGPSGARKGRGNSVLSCSDFLEALQFGGVGAECPREFRKQAAHSSGLEARGVECFLPRWKQLLRRAGYDEKGMDV